MKPEGIVPRKESFNHAHSLEAISSYSSTVCFKLDTGDPRKGRLKATIATSCSSKPGQSDP